MLTVIEGIDIARHVALLGMAVVCVYTDLSRGKLYNVVTLGGLCLGLATAYLLDAGYDGAPHLKTAALAAAIGGGALLIGHLAGGLAGGDYKFMAAVGALGPVELGIPPQFNLKYIVWALVFTVLVGAAIALGVALWRGRLLQSLKGSLRSLAAFRIRPGEGEPPLTMPYGVAIGIGAVWAWAKIIL